MEVVERLLELGANPLLENSDGVTAAFLANAYQMCRRWIIATGRTGTVVTWVTLHNDEHN